MKSNVLSAVLFASIAGSAATANAQVVLNEVFINPPSVGSISGGDADDSFEYIELYGRAGMDLDGYAVAVLSGGGASGVGKEVDETYVFQAGDTLVQRGTFPGGYAVLYNGAEQGSNQFANFVKAANGGVAIAITNANGFFAFADRHANNDPGKLENDGSITILLLRRASDITEFYKDENTEDVSEPGVITIDMIDYQIVDEVSFSNGQGTEYDRFDNKISQTSGFQPDALSRVNYYTGENPERAWVVETVFDTWEGASLANESWIRGDVIGSGSATAPVYTYVTADTHAPSDYLGAREHGRYSERLSVTGYALTPGLPNKLLSAGQPYVSSPFQGYTPRLGQVEFEVGDVNLDGVVNCVDRGLIMAEVDAGLSLEERLDDGTGLGVEGDWRWQAAQLNQLLAAAGLDGDELIESADLAAFDALYPDVCGCSDPQLVIRGDFNGDGAVTPLDISDFLSAYVRSLTGR